MKKISAIHTGAILYNSLPTCNTIFISFCFSFVLFSSFFFSFFFSFIYLKKKIISNKLNKNQLKIIYFKINSTA